MKISVVTPTYNREKLLKNLYNSLIENSKYDVEIEWNIMDDGSTAVSPRGSPRPHSHRAPSMSSP